MDRRTAIRECKELWGLIEESGLSKEDFLDTPQGMRWLREHANHRCPLCRYTLAKMTELNGLPLCNHYCPLRTQLGKDCITLRYNDDRPTEFIAAVKKLRVHG